MFDALELIVPHPRMIAASGVALLTLLADLTMPPEIASWESLGIKGLLIVAVIYLVRQLATQRDEDETTAAAREAKMVETLNATAHAMEELKAATVEQTGYYKVVARTLLNRGIAPKLPAESEDEK